MSSCQYPPSHQAPSGKRHTGCRGYSPKRKPYKTAKGTKCCKIDKSPRPSTGTKCGTIEVRGRRGRVPVYKGARGGVYYLTQTNDKMYIDSKDNIHKKPKACGTGSKRLKSRSPKRRSPKRKSRSPKRKSPKRRSPRRTKTHRAHLHTTKTLAKKGKTLHRHTC